MSVVVVGASTAGLSVAETLRRQGFDGWITLVGDEPALRYDRPPRSKEILSGAWTQERVQLRDDATITSLGLDLRLGTEATGADVRDRTVALADGSRVSYDELVVATGVRPRRLAGTDGVPGVHVLRTLDLRVAPRGRQGRDRGRQCHRAPAGGPLRTRRRGQGRRRRELHPFPQSRPGTRGQPLGHSDERRCGP
ncbi:FAD/NAD(P)-binding oxidoreductase [Pseudonocardia sp.]|uniref:FAD/NAD(P)-binding oxidoreductase n=1 Tax=Pseudonocardia sp. TaxID=60912 RepID=UPI0031FC917E